MTSYQSLINSATKILYDESDSPRIDAEVLMQHATQRDLAWLIAHSNDETTAQHQQAFDKLVGERKKGVPIAYLTGTKSFWSLELEVNSSVLIPRPDTETLVDQALERIDASRDSDLLDLGTGSGAVALAIAKERTGTNVIAIDASGEALEVAQRNAQTAKVTNVAFVQSNWYDALTNDQQFNLIVSNPPYIDKLDTHLREGDVRFEPISALVSDENGLADLRHIIDQAPHFLKNNGWLLLEHGNQQADEVCATLMSRGFFNVTSYTDLNKQPRISVGQWQDNA